MKTILLISLFFFCMLLAGCDKDGPDTTTNWVGVYTSQAATDTIRSLIITKNNSSSLRIEIKTASGGYLYTYTTLQNVAVVSSSQSTINERDNLTGGTGSYVVQGNLIRSGATITMAATATSGSDQRNLNFSGHK